MYLSPETKELITKEFNEFKSKMYKGLTPEQRKKYGMVYTPAKISIQMLEMCNLESLEGEYVLDPCCGSGNLLVAALLAGADADKLLGNELNRKMVKLTRRRIQNICDDIEHYPNIRNREKFRNLHHHIHVGDATNHYCLTHWSSKYNQNLTKLGIKVHDPTDEDDVSPSEDEALLTPLTEYPKDKWCKHLVNAIKADIDYPMADKELVLTAEDYEEILAEDIPDEEDLLSEAKPKKIKNKKQKIKFDSEQGSLF